MYNALIPCLINQRKPSRMNTIDNKNIWQKYKGLCGFIFTEKIENGIGRESEWGLVNGRILKEGNYQMEKHNVDISGGYDGNC